MEINVILTFTSYEILNLSFFGTRDLLSCYLRMNSNKSYRYINIQARHCINLKYQHLFYEDNFINYFLNGEVRQKFQNLGTDALRTLIKVVFVFLLDVNKCLVMLGSGQIVNNQNYS